MRYWLDLYGIDGFRVDAAGFVPDDFWLEAVPALRAATKRPILLLAEWGDLKMHRFGFDLTYSWDSYGRLKAVWKGAPASSFVPREVDDMQTMPPGGMRLRFTTNHDETGWDQPPVTLFGGAAGARAAFVAMALLPGRPLLYNGQEVESPQKLGLFVRDTVAWGQPDSAATRGFYRGVLHLLLTDSALVAGDFRAVATNAADDVIAYARGRAVVLVNTRSRAVAVVVTGFKVNGARDRLTDRAQAGDTVSLAPYGAVVLER
jgi:glycosidase